MPVFEYKAIGGDDSAHGGTITADTPRQARDILRQQGLRITQVTPAAATRKANFRQRHRGRRSQAAVVEFIREIATLLQADIPLLVALQTLVKQHGGHFRMVIQQLADHVSAGASLAQAMERHEAYFDPVFVSIVRVGESTGSLEAALNRLADFREKSQRLRSQTVTALIYPTIVLVVGLCVCIFLMTFVVPSLLNTFIQAGKELPAVTKAVKGVSDFLVGWWWAMLLGLAVVAGAFRMVLQTDRGRMQADRIVLRIPLLGELVRKENTARIAVVLGALLRSGLPFVQAVEITRQTLRNRVFRQALGEYERAVTAGKGVAVALENSQVFSPMVVQMLAVGQQAGQLEDMLDQLARAYDRQVSTATKRMTAMLEPLLILLLAILVGFVAFATILPILEISNGL